MIVNRLQGLGYRQLDALATEEPGKPENIYRSIDYAPLRIEKTALLVLPFLGQHGMCLDILIIGNGNELDGTAIKGAIDTFWERNQDHLIHQREITSEPTELLEKMTIRYLVVTEPSYKDDDILSLYGKRKIKTPRGKGVSALWRQPAFKARLDWSVSLIDMAQCRILERLPVLMTR